MFWIPLLPSIPLPIYGQLYIPMAVMAWFVSFQFATVIWLEMRTSACSTVSPACRASSTSAVPWPHLEHCWLLWKQHSTEFWRTWRCWGDYSSFARDVPCSHVNLYHVQFHWDWVVTQPLLSGNHEDYDFCFLWGCEGRRDFVHLDTFPLSFTVPYLWFCLYVVGQYFSTCFAMFCSGR